MALFNRTKKDSVLPEVDKYYEAEKRDRSGVAWLLALVSIVVVALIIIGLFLAGRWAYNAITDDNEVATDTSEDASDAPSVDGGSTEDTSGNNNQDNSDSNGGSTDEPAASDEEVEPDTSDEIDTPTTTPETGDSSGNLPNTGPADTLAIFAVTTAAGTVAHYAIERRKR